ncbi:cell division cycle-associated protein 7-like [Genypterus blacodes]|uniref:cell division cycle-associated protein 7-like n=1 Tax=Genypterus blacodes TaxID=154954 RepID=UPI003F759837
MGEILYTQLAGTLGPRLADVFAEESDDDRTFYGFSDGELGDHCDSVQYNSQVGDGCEATADHVPIRSAVARPFSLRVALRSKPPAPSSTDDDDEKEEEKVVKKVAKKAGIKGKKELHVKFKDEEERPSKEPGFDSADDSFLAKREQNIKANKAMLAQLMADLQKMPGGAGILKKQAGKQSKDKSSRPPRSSGGPRESRRNPERASRRQTRSMGGCEDPSAPHEKELELSLEDELLEVRRAPQRRGTPRPNQSKPHIVRPVEDITEDELLLVADNMTEKVYNRVTGSTCHQCRQKTVDTKTCCRSEDCRGIHGQFCGPCLRNRYGEDVKKALLDPEWHCPPCRGICNCSFCRQRDGRCPTGILLPLAQYHGFSDVHSYLVSLRNKLKDGDDVDAAEE